MLKWKLFADKKIEFFTICNLHFKHPLVRQFESIPWVIAIFIFERWNIFMKANIYILFISTYTCIIWINILPFQW